MAENARRLDPDDVPQPAFAPPTSGVFRRGTKREPNAPSPESIAAVVRELVLHAPIAVLLAPSCGEAVRACVLPNRELDDLGFPLALRLTAWLGDEYNARVLHVPEFIRPWLPMRRAAVVPMSTLAWRGGALIVPVDGITSSTLNALRDVGFAMGLELEAADRRACLAAFGDP